MVGVAVPLSLLAAVWLIWFGGRQLLDTVVAQRVVAWFTRSHEGSQDALATIAAACGIAWIGLHVVALVFFLFLALGVGTAVFI